jgi:hypothetical protein
MVWLSGYSQKTISRNVEDMTDRQVKNIEVKEDWKNEKIYLIKAVDTLTIDEAVEVDTVKVSLGKFLEVVYRVRGGSGEHLRVTKVVCVNNNHFGQSLSLETLNEEYSAKGTLKKRYSLDVNIFFNKGTYIARLTETIKTVNGGKKIYPLHFDPEFRVFCSSRVKDRALAICDDKTMGTKVYHKVNLSRLVYVYYQNCWYQKGADCYIKM